MRNGIRALALAVLAGCSTDHSADVDGIMAAYAAPGMPGASVMVIRHGEPVLTRSYGLAIVEEGLPVTPATNFRLASMTKQFTATAVLMLVDEGKLGLDDSLRRHLPDLPEFADDIMIRHVLNHTSGLMDYEPIYGDQFPQQIHDEGVLHLLAATTSTYFEPGTEYRYSNTGYALLAMLVERLSGMRFADYLHLRIFAPLGMANTVAYEKNVSSVPNRAFGYRVTDAGVELRDQSAWSAVLGDGGVYSSVLDLYRWDQALYAGGLLSPELRRQALTPGLAGYGFGLRIDDYRGHRRYHHDGETSGFRNFTIQFPDDELSVIVLTNRAEPDAQPLAEAIADLYLD